VRTGEAIERPIEPSESATEAQYWVVAARHGQRVLAVDMPHSSPARGLPDSVQVTEWEVHDRWRGPSSEPPEVLDEIRATWGQPDLRICNRRNDGTVAGFRRMRDDLIEHIQQKQVWITEQVAGSRWDLVTCTFGASHCIGHHQLHHYDETNPWHDPGAPDDVRDALPRVYEAIDAAIGSVVAAAGPDATAIVVASHGMGLYVGGYQLLERVLRTIDQSPVSRALAAPTRLPPSVKALARAAVPAALRRKRRALSHEEPWPLESDKTTAIRVANNRVGAVRINLKGREPNGAVEPDAMETTLDDVTELLLALRDPASGEPIVDSVDRSADLFGPERHADVPDLLVLFRRDLGSLEACTSPRTGLLRAPTRRPEVLRSGDHTAHARWWVRGPGLGAGSLGEVHALDLAPTVLQALGVPVPDGLDGSPLALPTQG
jgi:predicted AlkP superfamily phosphohydrolase/phosphomutase